ncbi:hypothetical protein SPRG_14935 [Saprolegnia parasitica CBS 223.65]|uniref:ABC transporter domain-containing protein n=1 Tax=Saprolegnia parasitica (strain CBS 223.65) TaxID=695850 RepID=A0A067BSN7_SAPPC|nr:hypothetical protein SPRG_14935 [Saprolegnia parasitica CBS 223.65]KDO19835.1 hypothetical protein SPRG_14935 [Saprolegnia parasitica CBS 223.65]|eukprot:XP_012209447.1 hypothetical protein SPRG_14935 [Saprolegnia parasitica CBS 223.65]
MSLWLETQLEQCFFAAQKDLSYYSCLVNSGVFSSSTCALTCPDGAASCCSTSEAATQCIAEPPTRACKALFDTYLFAPLGCASLSSAAILAMSLAALVCIVGPLWLLVHWRKQRAAKTSQRSASELRLERQVGILVWKNFQLIKHRPCRALFELLLPLLLVGALVVLGFLPTFAASSSDEKWNTRYSCTSNVDCTTALLSTRALVDVVDLLLERAAGLWHVFLLSYLRFVPSLTSKIVLEKEKRLTEGMKMMGVSDAALRLSWLLADHAVYTWLALAMALELKFGHVFPMADLATLFFFFAAFGLSMVSFAHLMSIFFNKSKTAAIASVLVWVLAFLPFYAVGASSHTSQYAAALSAPTAFALGIEVLTQQAQRGTEPYYSIASTQATGGSRVSDMTWFLLSDAVCMLLACWYLEQVVPQQYGVPKPWYFPLHRAYWAVRGRAPRPSRRHFTARFSDAPDYDEMATPSTRGASPLHQANVEPPTQALRLKEQRGECVQLVGLRKTFKTDDGESKVAVHNLHVTMYAGQITAFLGHNGAGKTTTISMLTGLFPPTKGTAYVFGKTITDDMDAIRASMGVCPQHDVLYDELSVLEHLQLYAALKGIEDASAQIDAMVAEVGLVEKRHVASAKLSGGQKRKLSVAIALLGKSQVVFLDEPTSGMDPYSRRFTWNVLQRNRENRVMVLTTHFMDEADLLGDRIVILSDGRLCCAGSSLFLKQLYGTGYNLTLVKTSACNVTDLVAFLRRFVPDANVLSNVGAEVVVQLPTHASPQFPDLLLALDNELETRGIVEYGISITTLEEVFLRIAHQGDVNGPSEALVDWHESPHIVLEKPPRAGADATRPPSFRQQYVAMLQKRWRVSRRDKKNMMFTLVIPVLFLGLLALLPSIRVASYLPSYARGVSVEEVENYKACNIVLTSSTANYECAYGIATAVCPNCQPFVYGCGVTNYCSEGSIRGNSSSPYCAMDGGFLRSTSVCMTEWFSHCSLGLADCDATACCDATKPVSPYYPCSSCASNKWPCYSGSCIVKRDAKLQGQINTFLACLIIVIGFAFVPASVVVFIVKEKDPHQNAKYQQLACGSSVFAYWFSIWTHDVLFMLVPVAVAVALLPSFASFQNDSASILGGLALLLTHVLSMLPLAYLFTFRFTKHAAAQTSVLVFCLVTGGLLSIISFLCRLIDFDLIKNQLTLAQLDTQYLRWVYLLFPGYALTDGLFQIGMRKYGNPFGGMGAGACPIEQSCWSANVPGCCTANVFELSVAGRSLLYGAVEAVLLTLLVLYADRQHTARLPTKADDAYRERGSLLEPDVAAEAVRVMQGRASGDNVVLHKLHKQYGAEKIALHQLSLGIPKGECFGYLGINGAGKSTTLQILHGALQPTSGSVTVNGHLLPAELRAARASTGYCPQFDALHDLLTVQEELELYARLKGVIDVKAAVAAKMDQFGLHAFKAKRTQGLSGGNKRKVSTAIALLGSPTLLLLDEPSTGMDPAARRDMWDVIVGVLQEKSCSVILTTHSMEECQALCTRIGILVSGQLKCLGTAQHLKHKFGRGFTLDLKLESLPEDAWPVLPTASSMLTMDDIVSLCNEMDCPERLERLQSDWVLQHYVEKDGGVPLDVLRQWWATDNASDALLQRLDADVEGATLIEHHGEHFRLHVEKAFGHTLHSLFAWMEGHKKALHLAQYSVSDTTLEEIFNDMAASQDEEKLSVNGRRQLALRASSRQSVRSYHRSSSLHKLPIKAKPL